jgi:hypothetical protein
MSTDQSMPPDYYGKPLPKISARPEDVATTESIIKAMYECISGPPGKPRDWRRLDSLSAPGSRSIRTGRLADGSMSCKVMTSEEYQQQMNDWLVKNGFFETEIHRTEERFGNIAHVFSSYESRHRESDREPYMRGINSIQLLYDGARWWVLNVMWQHESPEFPIPKKYLPEP